jgi:hypothetical protein
MYIYIYIYIRRTVEQLACGENYSIFRKAKNSLVSVFSYVQDAW